MEIFFEKSSFRNLGPRKNCPSAQTRRPVSATARLGKGRQLKDVLPLLVLGSSGSSGLSLPFPGSNPTYNIFARHLMQCGASPLFMAGHRQVITVASARTVKSKYYCTSNVS